MRDMNGHVTKHRSKGAAFSCRQREFDQRVRIQELEAQLAAAKRDYRCANCGYSGEHTESDLVLVHWADDVEAAVERAKRDGGV